ncbi:MAG: autotransporter outer membrane beta-barrel domain-containing protein [Rhodanobacter sp.]
MKLKRPPFSPRALRGALLLFPLAMASQAAFAVQSPALDRVSLWVGGYYPTMDTVISASDKNHLASGHVDLENDLGFRRHKITPRVRLDFLVGEHQGFALDYYNVRRTRTKSLSRDVSYGGNDYRASASVSGKLDFDFGSVAYRWWLGSGNDVFGVGLGGAYYGVHAGIRGTASVNDEHAEASTSTSETAWAPLLQLGWRHAFNNNVRIYADVSGVKKNGGRLSGHIYNTALGVEWFPWENVGVGAEYDYTKIKLAQHKKTYNANLDMKLKGPSLFVRFRF